jgi:ATP-dependent helicase/nuclease subunit B
VVNASAALTNVRRYFLPWTRSLLGQAVEFLSQSWSAADPLNLSSDLVIVPTRQSGRRLREALAVHAAKRGSAVFPPRVIVPDGLLSLLSNVSDAASRTASLLEWTRLLQSLDLAEFQEVFPVEPPSRDFRWALQLAQQFTRLQHTLAESGLGLKDVISRVGDDFPEAERWLQIAALEERHHRMLADSGLTDRHSVRIAAARNADLSAITRHLPSIQRIVLLSVPDPQPLVVEALECLSFFLPIDVVVYAPHTDEAQFDSWGRPNSSAWSKRLIEVPNFEQHVHLCKDPNTQARRVVEVVEKYPSRDGRVAVGVADADLLPFLERSFRGTGVDVYNPEGLRRGGDALYQLIVAFSDLKKHDSFAAIERLARCPDVLIYLQRKLGAGFAPAAFLRNLDRIRTRQLPQTLGDAVRHALRDTALGSLLELRELLMQSSSPNNVSAALQQIFEGRSFSPDHADEEGVIDSAKAWAEVMSEVVDAISAGFKCEDEELIELSLVLYAESIRYLEKPPGAIELQGWLELLWEDSPHVLVAGFNDGRVPEAIVADPFLPESLRARLGLKTNGARFARDAYLLCALTQSRAAQGRVDLFVGKNSSAGDPLRPSRLLLQCSNDELPRRVGHLFSEPPAEPPQPPWTRAWKLQPRTSAVPAQVAVTGFRSWLNCPFRFYLGRVLRMEPVDAAKTEMDVLDFGTLCHHSLEGLASETHLKQSADSAVIREFLLERLDAEARRRFGTNPALPLIVQLESARQRLSRAAEVHAAGRAEGWVIEGVEQPFEIAVGGLRVIGKIDRIDRNERTGDLRILDYKTSDRPVEPWEAHVRSIRRGETPAPFTNVIVNGREYVWADLQLPLYERAIAGGSVEDLRNTSSPGEKRSEHRVWCGYFNLPKAASETGIRIWEDYTPDLARSAWQCAESVARAIAAEEFWPPNENVRPEYDAFAPLFHHGIADSVVWTQSRAAQLSLGL